MIRALVVDDHTIFRSGLKRLLLDESDIRVTAEARSGAEAMQALRREPFELVLLDINLEGRSGLEVLATIRRDFPTVPALMLSMYPEEQYALVAMRAGASGYLPKDAEPAELIEAIRAVARGGTYLSARIAARVQDQLKGFDDRPPHQRLTVREHQILLMLLKGTPPADIGEEMMISIKTVSAHRTHILEKLGVSSTAELVLYAVRNGIIQ
ncbi:response regulator transcription factor [Pelomonas sp. KK5]|uniref:response regulator n=1 Tax=Pelomonas sp. KK5 TaxID=1855730 RepID=UPI00097BDE03|nr:response regulator transcription factor [Pelomonas sp. KK5]